jgi:sulfotransferase family protein
MESEFEPGTGCWGDHVISWLATRQGLSNFLLLRYEDMKQRTHEEASKIACFLGLDSSPERVAGAVALSSADRMRKLEAEQAHQWKETKKTRQDKPFVGKALSGGWKSRLPETCVIQIESAWGRIMQMMGYELATNVGPQNPTDLWSSELIRGGLLTASATRPVLPENPGN